jgi:hypothetical protein
MSSVNELHVLDDVDIPDGLIVNVVRDPTEFFNRKVTLNKATTHWFGSAMKQGNRLQFLTTMTIQDYLTVVKVERLEGQAAAKGATVEELQKKSNRPKIPSQHKLIKGYLVETACVGDKWILPNFVLNYGVGWQETMPTARLTILVTDDETLSWPAVFEPPSGVRMPSTDGGHRTGSIQELVMKDQPDGIDTMMANGVGVTIVMEGSDDDRRQDFADCGKAKPIADSVKATWDLRDAVSSAARELVVGNTFLHKYVDATSASVNLSTNSALIWSMSAVRGSLISGFWKSQKDFTSLSLADKKEVLDGSAAKVSAFIDVVVARVPLLRKLVEDAQIVATAKANGVPSAQIPPVVTPAKYRKENGGCVLMRGAGFGLLMRAYRYAEQAGIKYSDMANRLADVDWFMLTGPEPNLPPQALYEWLTKNAHPAWFKLVAFNPGTGGWRLKGTNDNLDAAFEEIVKMTGLRKPEVVDGQRRKSAHVPA